MVGHWPELPVGGGLWLGGLACGSRWLGNGPGYLSEVTHGWAVFACGSPWFGISQSYLSEVAHGWVVGH